MNREIIRQALEELRNLNKYALEMEMTTGYKKGKYNYANSTRILIQAQRELRRESNE